MTDTISVAATRAPERTAIDITKVTAWDNHALMVTDLNVLHETVKRPALSPSTSKSMASCRARWVADRLLPRDEDPFAPAPIGTSAHEVLERLFQQPPAKRTPDDLMLTVCELADEKYGGHVHGASMAEKQRWIQAVYEKSYRIHDMEDVYAVSVSATEAAVTGEKAVIGGVPFVGHIDRVDNMYNEDGDFLGVKLIDYKTGKQPTNLKFGDDHGDQMRLYKLAYEAMYGIEVVECQLYYTGVGKTRRVPITKAALNKTLRAFVAAWSAHNKSVEESKFATKPSALCGWCPLVNTCPSAFKPDGEAYVARIDGIPTSDELRILSLSEVEEHVASPYEVEPEPVLEEWQIAPEPVAEPEPDPEPESTICDDAPPALTPTDNKTTSRRGRKSMEATMSNNIFGPELDKPWDTPVGDALAPNTPVATALFGITSKAVELLAENGYPANTVSVRAATGVLTRIVAEAENAISGKVDFGSGLNTRLRGAMFSYIAANPLPFGQGADVVEKWMDDAIVAVVLTAETVAAMHARGKDDSQVYRVTKGASVLGVAPVEPEPAF